jgi:DNA-binding transcriptional MerR regulator
MAAARGKTLGARVEIEAVQEYYSIGEVCSLTDLRPHVLRYWESQFRILNPAKNRSGNRVYARREVELVLLVKQLLYTEKYTIEGARQKLDAHRRGGELRDVARRALVAETIETFERELRDIADVLAGRATPKAQRADDLGADASTSTAPSEPPNELHALDSRAPDAPTV